MNNQTDGQRMNDGGENPVNILLRNILALDIDAETKSAAAASIQNGRIAEGITILSHCRSRILNELHNDQNRLYEIDYIIQNARR